MSRKLPRECHFDESQAERERVCHSVRLHLAVLHLPTECKVFLMSSWPNSPKPNAFAPMQPIHYHRLLYASTQDLPALSRHLWARHWSCAIASAVAWSYTRRSWHQAHFCLNSRLPILSSSPHHQGSAQLSRKVALPASTAARHALLSRQRASSAAHTLSRPAALTEQRAPLLPLLHQTIIIADDTADVRCYFKSNHPHRSIEY